MFNEMIGIVFSNTALTSTIANIDENIHMLLVKFIK